MLGKLIKYDMKAAVRSFAPLYLALFGMSAVLGLFARFNVSDSWVLTFLFIAYGVTLIICWVIPIVILTLRFRKNLLEDEGYLSFVLPVSTLEHIIAKVISALIITVVCVLAVVLSFLIIGLISAQFAELQKALEEIARVFNEIIDVNLVPQILKSILLSILASVQIITQIYTALAIGHLFKDHETLAAAGAFIGIALVLSFLSNMFHLPGLGDSIYAYCAYSVALTVIFTASTWFILDRNLNLS